MRPIQLKRVNYAGDTALLSHANKNFNMCGSARLEESHGCK